MRNFIEQAARKALEEHNHIRSNMLEIPFEVWLEHGMSGFHIELYQDACSNEAEEQLEQALKSFDLLCSSTTKASAQAIKCLSVAGALLVVLFDRIEESAPNLDDIPLLLDYLQSAAALRGCVLASLVDGSQAYMAKLKPILSQNGEMGAKVKHGPVNEFKAWAENEAADIRGMSAADLARHLVKRIPPHIAAQIADIKDPATVLYRHFKPKKL